MPKTLEELQEENLKLRDELEQTTNNLNLVTGDLTKAHENIESLKLHNQKLFLRATSGEKEEEEQPKPKTPEEIANELGI